MPQHSEFGNPFCTLSDRELMVFDWIQKNGPVTKSTLLNALNLNLTTLNRVMETLEENCLITKSGISASTGGRKPIQYDAAEKGICAVGVDISRIKVQIMLVDVKLRLLGSSSFRMDASITPEICIDKVAKDIYRLMEQYRVKKKQVVGVGIGAIGPVDVENGVMLAPQGFANPEWEKEIPIVEMCRIAFALPCTIDNGANAAALVESLFGAGRGKETIAYINCGIGIRSAVVRDNRIIRSINNREDAFAHMTIDMHGEKCVCGAMGCLEQYVSLLAVKNRIQAAEGRALSNTHIFERAQAEDQMVTEQLLQSAKALAIGLCNLSKLLSPDLIILSGMLITEYPPYFDAAVAFFMARQSRGHYTAFKNGGMYGEATISVGAACMMIENIKRMGRNK